MLILRRFLLSRRVEAYGGGVDAETLLRRLRPVVEHVPQVRITFRTGHLGPHYIWVCDQQ